MEKMSVDNPPNESCECLVLVAGSWYCAAYVVHEGFIAALDPLCNYRNGDDAEIINIDDQVEAWMPLLKGE